jgi:G3E family GTPase
MTAPVPVTLISGYLGAGKTTLVNTMLRNAAGRRLAVLVNEFGSLSIDADLIVARDGNLISISGGCICCSFGSDLVAALIEIRGRKQPIDQILIETSGVALPGAIVQSLALLPGLVLDGVIVLADAETIEARADDRYMGDTVRTQLAAADVIVLNRIDLVTPERTASVSRWLTGIAPGIRVLPAVNADIPPDVILGRQPGSRPVGGLRQAPAHSTVDYETIELEIDTPVDVDRLAGVLVDPEVGILRAKGFLQKPDGEFVTVQTVGRRAHVESAAAWIDGPGRLVCIGLTAEIRRSAILAALPHNRSGN